MTPSLSTRHKRTSKQTPKPDLGSSLCLLYICGCYVSVWGLLWVCSGSDLGVHATLCNEVNLASPLIYYLHTHLKKFSQTLLSVAISGSASEICIYFHLINSKTKKIKHHIPVFNDHPRTSVLAIYSIENLTQIYLFIKL